MNDAKYSVTEGAVFHCETKQVPYPFQRAIPCERISDREKASYRKINLLSWPARGPHALSADTAWELVHRPNKTSIEFYLKTRAEQGYNVVQTVAVSKLNGTTRSNFYGDLPFNNSDPTKPNEAYFELVDWTVDLAASYGNLIALVSTWGMYVNGGWHSTERIFNESN
ncbi:Hypothetical protein PHPALM_7376, partial [Phytophthora palmivora]